MCNYYILLFCGPFGHVNTAANVSNSTMPAEGKINMGCTWADAASFYTLYADTPC